MNILNFDQQSSVLQIQSSLLNAFQRLKFISLTQKTQQPAFVHFSGVLALSRVKQYLHADFKAKIMKNKLIKLQLSLNPQICSFSRWLLEFCKKRFAQLCHFVFITNNLQLKEREGVLEFQESSGNINYRTFIYSVFLLTSKTKREVVVLSHVRKMIKIYTQTLQNIIFYYRIPGFNLNQLQLILQQQNAVQLKSVAEKIILLKSLFDETSQSNPIYDQYHEQFKEAQTVVTGLNSLDTMISAKIKKEYFHKIESDFRYEEKTLIKNFQEFQRSKFDSILTAIQIKQKTLQLPMTQGGFSQITYGLYDFVPLISVHQQVNIALGRQVSSQNKNGPSQKSPQRTGCCLVKKVSLNRELMTESLKNQCIFLTYMKAKICPYFAKYYCNKGIVPFADGEIYIQYYPTSLDQTRLRQQGKLKVLEDVCMGLLFLGKQQILHRDLKELNIMVDRSKRGRIIDFGSVAPFFDSQKFKLKDTKLRSTQGYFYSYKDLRLNYENLIKRYSKEQYYEHPNFDMFSLGRIIHKEFSLEMITQEGEFMRHFLHYLTLRCLEVDPQRRWPIGKVLSFVRQLLSYVEHQNRYWKYGFDDHCRAHIIGSTFSTKQYSNEQRSCQQTLKRK